MPSTHPSRIFANARSATGSSRHRHRRFQIGFMALLGVLAALFCGCAVTSDYKRPEVAVPDGWRTDLARASAAANIDWWRQFNDPVLDELIASAIVENKDLSIATARIAEFAGRLQAGRSALYPNIFYGGDVSRDQQSEEQAAPLLPGEARVNDNYLATLGVGWELDLWRRVARANEASRAELFASMEARHALLLSLVSAVAVSYLDLLSLDRQLEITRETVAYREKWLETFRMKGAGGQISGLELAQVRTAYEEAAANVPRIELQISRAENALSILLGRDPGPIRRGHTLETLGMLEVPQGIPADVLIRRPDIREKEQSLIAAHARIGEVRARYFPKISLTGLLGLASTQISSWLDSSASLWSVGLGVVGPLFAGGRITGEVRQAEAREQQMLDDYLKTIQMALREVEDALISIQKLRELLAIQQREIAALEEYALIARNRYDAGYSFSYLEILDADRNLYNTRIQEAETLKDFFAALVSGYKAMGGGWDATASTVKP